MADSTEFPLIVIEEKAEEGDRHLAKKREEEVTVGSAGAKRTPSKHSVRRLRSEEDKDSTSEYIERQRSRHSRHSSMKRLMEKSRQAEEQKVENESTREAA